jgi:hypothetical protein
LWAIAWRCEPLTVLLALRILWFALPVAAVPAIGHGLDGASTAVVVTGATQAWLAWGAGIVGLLVPRSASLTALRLVVPAAPVAAVASLVAGDGVEPAGVIALGAAGLAAGLLLGVPAIADALVDGSSYGPERRFALRLPAALLVGPVEVVWAALVAPVAVGALLLAARQWVGGAVVLAAGAAAARPAMRALHQLSRRWLVFVTAGVVVHDPLVLTDPVLVPRRAVRGFGPAPVGDEANALDLTGGGLGLVLELELAEPLAFAVAERRRQSRVTDADRVLLTPARPGAVLAEARDRRFPTAPTSFSTH